MTISTRQAGGIMILDIGGRIVIGEESASVRAAIRNLLNKGYKRILFNLGHVDCIDTIGLGPLVGAFTNVRKQGGELKLLNIPKKFADVKQIDHSRCHDAHKRRFCCRRGNQEGSAEHSDNLDFDGARRRDCQTIKIGWGAGFRIKIRSTLSLAEGCRCAP